MTDTLYCDVSEWQVPCDDSYPHPVICIRSNDGTYRDKKWAQNYDWCKRNTDNGRLAFFQVYFVWHENWWDGVATLKSQVGHPHPKMVVMLDVESWGGGITGNQSAGINAAFEDLCAWLGDRRRVIGYGNQGDLDSLWPQRPAGIRLVVAKYSTTRPNYPGQIAHQYTDGAGYGTGPQSSPPFGNCDHNWAYGLSPHQFADILGVGAPAVPEIDYTTLGYEQLAGPRGSDGYGHGWEQLGQNEQGQNLTFVDALARVKTMVEEQAGVRARVLKDDPEDAVPTAAAQSADKDYARLEYEQLAGPVAQDGYGHGWPQLGGMSVTDALAHVKRILEGSSSV